MATEGMGCAREASGLASTGARGIAVKYPQCGNVVELLTKHHSEDRGWRDKPDGSVTGRGQQQSHTSDA